MTEPNTLTLIAARFDRPLDKGEDSSGHPDGSVLASGGTEVDWNTVSGYPRRDRTVRIWVAIWRDRQAAQDYLDRRAGFLPILSSAVEHGALLTQPIACHGEVNWANDGTAAGLYTQLAPRQDKGGPIMVMTTLGLGDPDQGLVEFGKGVTQVRAAFAENPAVLLDINMLHDIPFLDGPTLTLWRSERDMMQAAYRTDPHKTVMNMRNGALARASFTRMELVRAEGSWRGTDLSALGPT